MAEIVWYIEWFNYCISTFVSTGFYITAVYSLIGAILTEAFPNLKGMTRWNYR